MISIGKGACHSIFIYDIAFSINLNEAERLITSFTQRDKIKHKRRAPRYFEFHTPPLRLGQEWESSLLAKTFNAKVELVVYDFGAVSVIYRMPMQGDLGNILLLSENLYENEELLNDSRERVEKLLQAIKPAVSKANISSFVEDYFVFQIEGFIEEISVDELLKKHASVLAQILRAEPRELSADEVNDALSHRISYGKDDVAVVDWNAALLVDQDPEDILTVLEFANVELLEMRFLDRRLDDALEQAYERLSKRSQKWFAFRSDPADLRDVSQWQVDSAILFEGVNNVLKLLGDQYLARLYRLVAQRFHLEDWDTSIFRKLETLQSIYQKLSDQVVTRRMEMLEWIIIVLIAVSIILPFFSY